MTKIIGLTGGIATGKSTVSKMFLDEKIPVIDTDEIAKNVLAINTDEYHKVVSLFSNEILQVNGEINRKLLGRIIFSNIQKRNKLNDIVHPKVKQIVLDLIQMYKQQETNIVVIDVPLLFESEFQEIADSIIVVFSTLEKQVSRLMERDNISKEYALMKINAQMPLKEKMERADYVIDNSKSILKTKKDFIAILKEIEV
jgi:dephospho-CoA kinase